MGVKSASFLNNEKQVDSIMRYVYELGQRQQQLASCHWKSKKLILYPPKTYGYRPAKRDGYRENASKKITNRNIGWVDNQNKVKGGRLIPQPNALH